MTKRGVEVINLVLRNYLDPDDAAFGINTDAVVGALSAQLDSVRPAGEGVERNKLALAEILAKKRELLPDIIIQSIRSSIGPLGRSFPLEMTNSIAWEVRNILRFDPQPAEISVLNTAPRITSFTMDSMAGRLEFRSQGFIIDEMAMETGDGLQHYNMMMRQFLSNFYLTLAEQLRRDILTQPDYWFSPEKRLPNNALDHMKIEDVIARKTQQTLAVTKYRRGILALIDHAENVMQGEGEENLPVTIFTTRETRKTLALHDRDRVLQLMEGPAAVTNRRGDVTQIRSRNRTYTVAASPVTPGDEERKYNSDAPLIGEMATGGYCKFRNAELERPDCVTNGWKKWRLIDGLLGCPWFVGRQSEFPSHGKIDPKSGLIEGELDFKELAMMGEEFTKNGKDLFGKEDCYYDVHTKTDYTSCPWAIDMFLRHVPKEMRDADSQHFLPVYFLGEIDERYLSNEKLLEIAARISNSFPAIRTSDLEKLHDHKGFEFGSIESDKGDVSDSSRNSKSSSGASSSTTNPSTKKSAFVSSSKPEGLFEISPSEPLSTDTANAKGRKKNTTSSSGIPKVKRYTESSDTGPDQKEDTSEGQDNPEPIEYSLAETPYGSEPKKKSVERTADEPSAKNTGVYQDLASIISNKIKADFASTFDKSGKKSRNDVIREQVYSRWYFLKSRIEALSAIQDQKLSDIFNWLIAAPVNLGFFAALAANNIELPILGMLLEDSQTILTESMIFIAPNAGKQFILDDGLRKRINYYPTQRLYKVEGEFYSGVAITRPESIYVVPNAVGRDYVGGCGNRYINQDETGKFISRFTREFKETVLPRVSNGKEQGAYSVYFVPQPSELMRTAESPVLFSSGYPKEQDFRRDMRLGTDPRFAEVKQNGPSFVGQSFLNRIFGIYKKNTISAPIEKVSVTRHQHACRINNICLEMPTRYYSDYAGGSIIQCPSKHMWGNFGEGVRDYISTRIAINRGLTQDSAYLDTGLQQTFPH